MKDRIEGSLEKAKNIINQFMVDNTKQIEEVATMIAATFSNEHRAYILASDESFIVAEKLATLFLSKSLENRPAFPAVLLSSPSLVLDITKNYSQNMAYSRQIDALMEAGDLLIVITQTPDMDGIVRACKKAISLKANIVLLSGKDEGRLSTLALKSIRVPISPATVEEGCQLTAIHIIACSLLASLVDEIIFGKYAKE